MGLVVSKHEQVYNAAVRGDANGVRNLIVEGASPEVFKDKKQRTALLVASSHAETYDVALTLLQLGANIRAYRPGKDGGFALHHAARKGLERTVALLLQWGADPLASNDDGETALDVARNRGFVAVVRMLEDRVCLFCGMLTQQSGAILVSNWLSKNWWVVVLPLTSGSARPQKLEVVFYSSPKSPTPQKAISLSATPDILLSKEGTPDVSVTITDSKTKSKVKLVADKESGNPSAVVQLYNACLGVPQGPQMQVPVPTTGSSLPPPVNPDKGKDLFRTDDVALELAIQESLKSAAAEGISVSNPPPRGDSSGSSRLRRGEGSGSGSARPHTSTSTSAGNYGGWAASPTAAYNGWGAPSRPSPTASSSQAAPTSSASPPPPASSPVTSSPQAVSPQPTPESGATSWTSQGEATYNGWGGVASTSSTPVQPEFAPSAPPLPSDEAIHYPVIGEASGPSKSEGLCAVCMDATSNAVCIPCGHVAGCLACLTEVKKKGFGCPVCRTPIREVVKVYMATA